MATRIADAGGPSCEIVIITTSGDRLQDAPLSDGGGKRLFVKEIEDALLRGQVDLAVHSSKDMPVVLPEGLAIVGVLEREDPLDAIVLPAIAHGSWLAAMKDGPSTPALRRQPSAMTQIDALVAHLGQARSIGTGSVRRIAQLARLLPGARFTPIRGNLDTRLRKLDEGAHDALVLAVAGLRRLGFASRISLTLPAAACVPAPGQGIVAIESRAENTEVREVMTRMGDADAGAALAAERALVEALGGGCQTPVGALATLPDRDTIELVAAVIALDGSRVVRARGRGARADATALGRRVAAQLIGDGADEILAEARRAQGAVEGIQH